MSVPKPSYDDISDAIDHAALSYDEVDEDASFDDFDINYIGKLSVKELEQYDDINSWAEDIEDQDDLANFRGHRWAEMAAGWGDELPPIIVVTGETFSTIGDGRGRVTYARWKNIPLHVWELKYKTPQNLTENSSSSKPNANIWYHGGNIEGDINSLYLTPDKALAKIHGEVFNFEIDNNASWLDLDSYESFAPSMDSIGYNKTWIEKMKNKYDVVWDSEDYKKGYKQIFILNPAVLKQVDLMRENETNIGILLQYLFS